MYSHQAENFSNKQTTEWFPYIMTESHQRSEHQIDTTKTRRQNGRERQQISLEGQKKSFSFPLPTGWKCTEFLPLNFNANLAENKYRVGARTLVFPSYCLISLHPNWKSQPKCTALNTVMHNLTTCSTISQPYK